MAPEAKGMDGKAQDEWLQGAESWLPVVLGAVTSWEWEALSAGGRGEGSEFRLQLQMQEVGVRGSRRDRGPIVLCLLASGITRVGLWPPALMKQRAHSLSSGLHKAGPGHRRLCPIPHPRSPSRLEPDVTSGPHGWSSAAWPCRGTWARGVVTSEGQNLCFWRGKGPEKRKPQSPGRKPPWARAVNVSRTWR